MSAAVVKRAPAALFVMKSVLSGVGGFFATLAAAGAVADAVENRRLPKAADLAVLGLQGVEFRRNY